jgi:hypothetical protein
MQRVKVNGFWYWKINGKYQSAIKIKGKLWRAEDCDFFPEPEEVCADFMEPNDNEFIKLIGG